jgi:hypothetical protein
MFDTTSMRFSVSYSVLFGRRPRRSGRRLAPVLALLLATLVVIGTAGCSGGGANGGDGLTAPTAPTGVSATSQDGAVSLEWGGVDGADTYRVYRSTGSGEGASGSPLETEIGAAGYVDDTAENGTTYYYVVTAVAGDGGGSAESDPSGEVAATPFSSPPGRP